MSLVERIFGPFSGRFAAENARRSCEEIERRRKVAEEIELRWANTHPVAASGRADGDPAAKVA